MHAGQQVHADSDPGSARHRRPAPEPERESPGRRDLGEGQAVPAALRSNAEAAYGASLGGVTLHTGPAADAFVRSQGARATTEGNRVALGSAYQPGTLEGDAVLAHELAHVVQQGARAEPGRGEPGGVPSGGSHSHEHEADHAAAAVLARSGQYDGAIRARGADPAAIAAAPAPRLSRGLGLRLQRCGSDGPIYATSRTGGAPTQNAPVYAGAKNESFYDTLGIFGYRDGAFRATIDGDGDQSAELDLAMKGSKPDNTVFGYPQQLDVTATRQNNTPEEKSTASSQTESFDISGKSAERSVRPKLEERTDGRSPTKITASGGSYVDFATMWIYPPSPDGPRADYRTVVERVKDYGEEKSKDTKTFSFSRDPNDIFPVFMPGTPQHAGSIWALDVTMGRFGDQYRLTFYKPDPGSSKVRMGISPLSGGSAAGTEAIDVEATGPLQVAVVRARGPLIDIDLNGDGKADIRLFERMTPRADYYGTGSFRQNPGQFRELRLTVTDPVTDREYGIGSRREVKGGEYAAESQNLNDEMDVVSAAATPEGLVEAAKTPDLITDLARTQATLKQLRQQAVEQAGFTAGVAAAYDRLVDAWLSVAGAAEAEKPAAWGAAKLAATTFHGLWLTETASGTTSKHHGGKEPWDETKNEFTGYHDIEGFSTGKIVTDELVSAVGAHDLKRSGTLMSDLGTRVARWVARKFRDQGTKEMVERADQVQGLLALTPMLEKLADKKDLKRVTAVFHSAPLYVQQGVPGNLPLRLYYWQDGSTWYLQDLTHPSNDEATGVMSTPVVAGQTEPPHSLFERLNDEKRFPLGYIQYVLPGENGRAGVVPTKGDNGWTVAKVLTWASLVLAGAALVAGFVASGGTASAVIIPLLWASSAVLGAAGAVAEMVEENQQGRLTGGKIVMGVAQLIGSLAGGAVAGAKAIGAARLAFRGAAAAEGALAAGKAAAAGAGLTELGLGLRILTMTQVGADSVQIVMATGQVIKQLEAIAASPMPWPDKVKALALALGQYGVMAGLTYAGVRGNLKELGPALQRPGAKLVQAGEEVLIPGRATAAQYAEELTAPLSKDAKEMLAKENPVRIVDPAAGGSSIALTRIEVVGEQVRVVVVDGVHPSSMREEAVHLEQLALGKQSTAKIKEQAAGNPAVEAELLRTRKAAIDIMEINSRWATASPIERVRAHEARLELEIDAQRRLISDYRAKMQGGTEKVDPVLVDNAFQNLDNLQIREAEMIGVRNHVSRGGKPGQIDPQFELPPSLFAKKTVPTTDIPPSWYTLSLEEFIRAYESRYAVSSLGKEDLKLRYEMGKRLNPESGRQVDINQDRVEVPAKYKMGADETIPLEGPNKVRIDPADQKTTSDLLAKRDAARNARDAAEAKVPPDTVKAKAELYNMIQASRELGEHASTVYVQRKYPGPPKPRRVYPPDGAPSRSGDFDQVWKAVDDKGKEIWLVNEAKGGSSDLGSRRVDRGLGQRAEQGSTPYYDDILRNMRDSGGELRDAADQLEKAAKAGTNIRYLHVSAPIESTASSAGGKLTSTLPAISIKEFDVSFGTSAAPTNGTVPAP